MLSNLEWRWRHLKWKLNMLFFLLIGVITTTRKKLDREREDRHKVQVNPDLCPLTYSQLVVHLYGEMFPSVLQVFCHLNSIPGRISKHCTTLGQSSTKLWRNIKKTEFLRLNGSFYIFIIIWRKQTSKLLLLRRETGHEINCSHWRNISLNHLCYWNIKWFFFIKKS